jgi:hypothetical protein
VRRGAAWTVERHQPAAWSLSWLRSRWRSCQRRANLGCQAANAGPAGGAQRVLAGHLVVAAIEDVRTPSVPFVGSLSAPLPVRHGVPGGVDGVRPDTTGQAVSETLSDRGVHGGRRTRPRGHRTGTRLADVPASSTAAGGHDGRVPMLGAAGVGRREHPRCRPVRSGPGRAGRVVGRGRLARGMVGRTLGAGGVRRLAAAVRTGSRPIGWAVTLNWGCPADRTLESSAMSVTRPAAAGCPQRDWSAETVSRRVSGGRTLAEAGVQTDCWHVRHAMARSLRCLPGGPGLGAGRPAVPARKPCLRHRSGGRRSVARGGSVGLGKHFPPVGAGGLAGALLGGGLSPGADRLAVGESLGRSCSGSASVKDSKDTSR